MTYNYAQYKVEYTDLCKMLTPAQIKTCIRNYYTLRNHFESVELCFTKTVGIMKPGAIVPDIISRGCKLSSSRWCCTQDDSATNVAESNVNHALQVRMDATTQGNRIYKEYIVNLCRRRLPTAEIRRRK